MRQAGRRARPAETRRAPSLFATSPTLAAARQCGFRKIHVIFELHEDKLVIHVVDQGAGFRLEDIPDPRDDENVLGDSGRGVLLMKAFMDEVDVLSSAAGGAELVMAKHHKR